jgi:hypothetical protein
MNELVLEALDNIELALEQSESEESESSVWEDIGYVTNERKQQLTAKSTALEALNEIKKYFFGQRTLTTDKADKLMSPIYKFFIEKGDHMFAINYLLPFRLNNLP